MADLAADPGGRGSLARRVREGLAGCMPWSLLACAAPGLALAAPGGEQVVAGSAVVSRPEPGGTLVSQASDKAILNWESFSIAGDEYVRFAQPGTTSIALNRVVGGDPSTILGSLSANGRIFLVNPRGIAFGAGARVDVGGLVASVLDIGDEDFLAGRYVLSRAPGAPPAGVVNEGVIRAREGGFVVLAGDYAANSGVVEARLGTVALASGSRMTLDLDGDGLVNYAVDEAALTRLAGVENSGALLADGGRVIMTAETGAELAAAAVNNQGLVQAHSVLERDGAIYLSAAGGDLRQDGTLDASGETGAAGGRIDVRADGDIRVGAGAGLYARGAGSGSGGEVRVVAERHLEVEEGAQVRTEGGSGGGRGGFIEVSGHESVRVRGIGRGIRAGSGGRLQLDPPTLAILPGFGVPGSNQIFESSIEAALTGSGTFGITAGTLVKASNGTGGPITAPISIDGGGRNLKIAVFPGSGSGKVDLAGVNLNLGSGDAFVGASDSTNVGVTIGRIFARNIDIVAGNVPGNDYVVIDDDPAAGVQAGELSAVPSAIQVSSHVRVTAGGDVTLRGAEAVALNTASIAIAAGGRVTLVDTGPSEGDGLGASIQGGGSGGLAQVAVVANGIEINTPVAAVIAREDRSADAVVALDAGSGALNLNDAGIFAIGDAYLATSASTGASVEFSSTGGGAVVLPPVPGSGTASIALSGASINLKAPFEFLGVRPDDPDARGAVIAASKNASVALNTPGDITLGTSPGPLVLAMGSDAAGLAAQAHVDVFAGGTVTINPPASPVFVEATLSAEDLALAAAASVPSGLSGPPSASVNVVAGRIAVASGAGIAASAEGSNPRAEVHLEVAGDDLIANGDVSAVAGDPGGAARIELTTGESALGGNVQVGGDVLALAGSSAAIEVHAHAFSFSGGDVSLDAGTILAQAAGASIDIRAEAGDVTQAAGQTVEVVGSQLYVDATGTLTQNGVLRARGLDPSIGINTRIAPLSPGPVALNGSVIAEATTGGDGEIDVHGSSISVGGGASLLARGSSAFVDLFVPSGPGTLTVAGGVRAEALGTGDGGGGEASVDVTHSGSGAVTVSGAVLSRAGSSAEISISASNADVTVSGPLTAQGTDAFSFANIEIRVSGDGNLTVSGPLTATAMESASASVGIFGNGNLTMSGDVTVTAGTSDAEASAIVTGFGNVNVSGNWRVQGADSGSIDISTGTGDITISGNLVVGSGGSENSLDISAGGGNVVLTSTGSLTLRAGPGGSASFDISGSNVTLNGPVTAAAPDDSVFFEVTAFPGSITVNNAVNVSGTNADASFDAAGNITFGAASRITVTGSSLDASAGGNLTHNGVATVKGDDPVIDFAAGGDVVLNGALRANAASGGADVALSGARVLGRLDLGAVVPAGETASLDLLAPTISFGTAAFTTGGGNASVFASSPLGANGMLFAAGQNLDLGGAALALGGGAAPGALPDALLNGFLATGVGSGFSLVPNGMFLAGGQVAVGTLAPTRGAGNDASRLLLQGADISLGAPIAFVPGTVPVVQLAAADPAGVIQVESSFLSCPSALCLSTPRHFGRLLGTTVVIGTTTTTGGISVGGLTGPVAFGPSPPSQNVVFVTSGAVSGAGLLEENVFKPGPLGNVNTSGMVAHLNPLVGTATAVDPCDLVPEACAPPATTTQQTEEEEEEKKKKEQGVGDEETETETRSDVEYEDDAGKMCS